MRFLLVLALLTAGCASKKPAAKAPGGTVENKQNDLDKDKSERNVDSADDKDQSPKKGGDPCDGGE
jgi:hypothetical protein